MTDLLRVSNEVADALAHNRPVVALETSIVGQGLPHPHNLRAARESEAAIREEGAVPATVAVLGGVLRVGLTEAELERIATGAIKVSSRDLGWAIALRQVGATTVAATMRAATMAGVRFFATGGIGGVHRGHPEDESADLMELSRTPTAVFCAGAKIILDLPLTLERLESFGVPLIGYGTDEFPAFYSAHSGCRVSARVDKPIDVARVLQASWATGTRGVVIAIPPERSGSHTSAAGPRRRAVEWEVARLERRPSRQQRPGGGAGGVGFFRTAKRGWLGVNEDEMVFDDNPRLSLRKRDAGNINAEIAHVGVDRAGDLDSVSGALGPQGGHHRFGDAVDSEPA